MKKQFNYGIIAIIVMLTFDAAYSQTSVQWTRTLQFEGQWQGPVTLVLGSQSFLVDYNMDFKTAIDGNVLTMDEWFSHVDLGDFKGANLLGYNPYDEMIHWFSADNFGTAHDHTGTWSTTKNFHMEHHSLQGGQPFAEFIDMKLKANNQKLEAKLVATLGTDTVQVLAGTLIRQNGNRPVLNNEEDETILYPNPSTGEIHFSNDEPITELTIMNVAGQMVYKANPNSKKFSAKLEKDGVYFARIISGTMTETKKIVMTK
jgi:hypothetical protein